MDQSTIFRIKKTGERIRTTADVTCNMSGKRIISAKNKTPIPMEAALVVWIVECSKNAQMCFSIGGLLEQRL